MLLFDVDGVLLCNQKIQKYVEHRSVRFLQDSPRFKEMYGDQSFEFASRINKYGYRTLGHTSMALSNTQSCVLEYNDYVFDDKTLKYVRENLTHDDYMHLNRVKYILHAHEGEVGVCTNTPLRYCECILYPGFGLLSNAFTSDSGLLKPNASFYDACENGGSIHFVDDSKLNIEAVMGRPNWHGIHVEGKLDLYKKLAALMNEDTRGASIGMFEHQNSTEKHGNRSPSQRGPGALVPDDE